MRYLITCMFAALLAWAAPNTARAEWWEARTDHFIVYSESSAADARSFAEKLERYDQALRSLQGMEADKDLSDSRKVTIFRSGDIGDVANLAGSYNSGIAGFYIPWASGPVAFVPAREELRRKSVIDAQTVLFHEYAHHFMFRHFPAAYPGWYVEGLAEVYSTIDLKDDGSFQLGNPPQARADDLFGGLNVSIKQMLLQSHKPDFEDYYGRYSYGWLLTHYLTFDDTRKGQLLNYLKLINSGTNLAAAAETAFGDLGQLEKEANRHKRRRLPAALVRLPGWTAPKVAMRKLGPDEEAIMRVRMRSKRGVDSKAARDVAGDAGAVASKYPGSYVVQLALAEAELDARNLDAAERAADAALAIRPNSAEALLYKGRVYLERGKAEPAHYATARSWFAKAHRADSDHPMPLYYNYLSYYRARTPIPENAVVGLEQAFMRAPYDDQLRLVVVRQLLIEKDGELARSLLTPLALSPHGSKRAKALFAAAELIDSGKLSEALEAIAGRMAEEQKEQEGG